MFINVIDGYRFNLNSVDFPCSGQPPPVKLEFELVDTQPAKCLICEARISEKILSAAQLTDGQKSMSAHNQMVHEVALARRAYYANTARQSRASLWMSFQQRVQKALQQQTQSEDKGAGQRIGPVTTFRPVTATTKQFQIVVMRLHRADKPRLGLVLNVFRGAKVASKTAGSDDSKKTKKKSTQVIGSRLAMLLL